MTVFVLGDKKLQRRFKSLVRRVENRRGLFKAIGVKLLNEIDKTFRNETHEGKTWSPLSEATKASKGRGGESAKILQDTGTLRRSFVSAPGRNQVAVGSPVVYSEPHEEGTATLPQRKMLPSKARGLEIAVDATKAFVRSSRRRSGV